MKDVWRSGEANTGARCNTLDRGSFGACRGVATDLIRRDIAEAGVAILINCGADVCPRLAAGQGGECVCILSVFWLSLSEVRGGVQCRACSAAALTASVTKARAKAIESFILSSRSQTCINYKQREDDPKYMESSHHDYVRPH